MELIVRVLACRPQAWACGPPRGSLRSIPRRSCTGWWRPPSSSRPFRATFCARCPSNRSNSLSCMPCSGPSRTGEARRGGHRASGARVAVGLDGDRPAEPAAPGHHGRSAPAGHGPAHAPSGRAGPRAGLPPAVRDRRVQGVHECAAEPFRLLGAA